MIHVAPVASDPFKKTVTDYWTGRNIDDNRVATSGWTKYMISNIRI